MVNLLLKNHPPQHWVSSPSWEHTPLQLFPFPGSIRHLPLCSSCPHKQLLTTHLTFLSFRRFLPTASQKCWWKGPLKVTSSSLPLQQHCCPHYTSSAMASFKWRLENLQGFHGFWTARPSAAPSSWYFFSNIQPAPSQQQFVAVTVLSSSHSGFNYPSLI